MNLFGCKFCDKALKGEKGEEQVCDRKNFDTLLWAIVTVFQVITYARVVLLVSPGFTTDSQCDFEVARCVELDSPCSRDNFQSCSQVLTQEDWNIVLFSGMQYTSHWAALYFVALMTFGNYVLFNLLVAILVEGFSNQVSET